MQSKEFRPEYDLLLEVVTEEVQWYDLELNQEVMLSHEEQKKLLKKKFAIQTTPIK